MSLRDSLLVIIWTINLLMNGAMLALLTHRLLLERARHRALRQITEELADLQRHTPLLLSGLAFQQGLMEWQRQQEEQGQG